MSHAEFTAANDDLLSQLNVAKHVYSGHRLQTKDLLHDPSISSLVNRLILLNEPWMLACVKREKHRMHLHESIEELVSTAIAGQGGASRDAGGVMGAILRYDYQQYGSKNFTPFIRKAVHDALALSPKAKRAEAYSAPLEALDAEKGGWVDRCQRRPETLAISTELMGVIEKAIERLPGDRKATARFIVEYVQATGERPPFELVAQNHVPPVTKQRGAQLVHDTFERLRSEIKKSCPNLAESGIGGWEEFSAVFGKHKRQKQRV